VDVVKCGGFGGSGGLDQLSGIERSSCEVHLFLPAEKTNLQARLSDVEANSIITG
jgi:hypothetical protein